MRTALPPRLLVLAAASLTLHAALIWLLLPRTVPRHVSESPPIIEIELVDQSLLAQGAPAPDQQPEAPPPAPATPPRVDGQPQPQPAPPRPAQPGRPAATVNLAGNERDQDPLSVSGRDVVPPRPDAAIRNRAPAYPVEAVRRRAEGVVGLRIHVTPAGLPAWVEVATSSGDPSLDAAAQAAVALWRFQPARDNGAPVAFELDYNIRFTLGQQR